MAKAAPPTALQSTFALFNVTNTAIGTIQAYRTRNAVSTPSAMRGVTIDRLKKLPTTLASALKRRPNTPDDLVALVNTAILAYRSTGASPHAIECLQAAADWARTYLQENTTPRKSGYILPPYTGASQ